jgi:hypothetical protein
MGELLDSTCGWPENTLMQRERQRLPAGFPTSDQLDTHGLA